jgi:arylsulfatase A-like enzyme
MKNYFHILLLSLIAQWGFAQTATLKRPNVVFILVDDLGLKDLSCTGSAFYETPNVDRIAKEGTVFTQGYAACAVCSPSRASIMTGKFTARHGITDWIGAKSGTDWRTEKRSNKLLPANYNHALSKEDMVLPEVMKANGYKTFFAGTDVDRYRFYHGSRYVQSARLQHRHGRQMAFGFRLWTY